MVTIYDDHHNGLSLSRTAKSVLLINCELGRASILRKCAVSTCLGSTSAASSTGSLNCAAHVIATNCLFYSFDCRFSSFDCRVSSFYFFPSTSRPLSEVISRDVEAARAREAGEYWWAEGQREQDHERDQMQPMKRQPEGIILDNKIMALREVEREGMLIGESSTRITFFSSHADIFRSSEHLLGRFPEVLEVFELCQMCLMFASAGYGSYMVSTRAAISQSMRNIHTGTHLHNRRSGYSRTRA